MSGAPRFTRESVIVLDRAVCEICDLDADGLPIVFWEQWTEQHLALHPPGAAAVVWTYRHAVVWRMELDN